MSSAELRLTLLVPWQSPWRVRNRGNQQSQLLGGDPAQRSPAAPRRPGLSIIRLAHATGAAHWSATVAHTPQWLFYCFAEPTEPANLRWVMIEWANRALGMGVL